MVIEHHTITLFNKKVFEKAVVTPPFKNPNPLENEACFLYVTEGISNSYSEEEHLVVNQNEGVLMKCGNYMYDVIPDHKTKQCGIVAIHFYPEVLKKIYEKEVPAFLTNKEQYSYSSNMALVQSDILIRKYIDGLLFYFENPNLASEELLILKFKEIILLLLNTKDADNIIKIMYNLFSPKSFSLKEVIEAHIFSPITVSDLAKLSYHSLASFKREFRKIYNDSPANYIKNRRLEKAATLLSISNQPIRNIAYDCLFNDLAHFSSSFKAKYTLSPSQYRMSQSQK
ncbi:helix-turn-helix transcriptional regulator [Aquimarina algiphila]|uniref:Helix-turn-helix transcriptional regulator n=1 Tax=Aquimarina algiphila TaxID=2047982 RepID=A0A554VQA8_9FLAO|nr:AraC family transcriptional regulator [Aquimarina algiphila]TSE10731.1 helix-turn-helix transcriptional regulator [Aquimarina algiphila]